MECMAKPCGGTSGSRSGSGSPHAAGTRWRADCAGRECGFRSESDASPDSGGESACAGGCHESPRDEAGARAGTGCRDSGPETDGGSTGASSDPVKERILALVVEKTGYPPEMLDLDLDLEADLGVDTVKQAELFAAIREIYNIPRDENRKLRDYPTLSHVIRFVYENRPDLATASITATPQSAFEPQPIAASH